MPVHEQPTIQQVLPAARERLAAAGIETARLDAELLLAHLLGRERTWLLAHDDTVLSPAQARGLDELVARREAFEPVAYITGRQAFRNLDLTVDRRVLIPRPETELLVEAALEWIAARPQDAPPARVLDVGAGSGAVALAILDEARPGSCEVHGADISRDALDVVEENARRCGLSPILHEGDLLDAVPGERWDVIVSNLPYIARDAAPALMPDVVGHEPHLALFGPGESGLGLIERLATQAAGALLPGGRFALELGQGQAAGVAAIAEAAGFIVQDVRSDLQGIERCLVARLPD